MKNIKDNESIEIIEHAIIIYKDGMVSMYDAIKINKTKVVFGKISNGVFIEYGGIPKDDIKKIDIVNDEII